MLLDPTSARGRIKIWLLCVIMIAAGAGGLAAGRTAPSNLVQAPQVDGTCDPVATAYGSWTSPQVWPHEAALQNPHLAVDGNRTLVLGNNIPDVSRSALIPESMFHAFIWEEGPSHAARTNGLHRLDPIGALSGDTILVFWGESADSLRMAYDWIAAKANSIWISRSIAGRWSEPQQLYSGSGLIDWRRSANLVRDSAGTAHLLFIDDKLNPSLLVHVSLSANPNVDTAAIGMGHSLAVSMPTTQRILGAFAGYDRNTGQSGVFVVAKRAAKWDSPLLIAPTESGDARDILLTATADTIAVFWRSSIGLQQALSRDGGMTWLTTALFRHAALGNLRGLTDRCGYTHLVFEDWSNPSHPVIKYVVTRLDGQWEGPTTLFAGMPGLNPGIGADGIQIAVIATVPTHNGFAPALIRRYRRQPLQSTRS